MKKILEIGIWLCGVAGIILMGLGAIAGVAGGVLLNHMWSNYFYPGVGFIILGIFLIKALRVYLKCCQKPG